MANFIISKKNAYESGMPSAHGVEFKGEHAKKRFDENYDKIFGMGGDPLSELVKTTATKKIYKAKVHA